MSASDSESYSGKVAREVRDLGTAPASSYPDGPDVVSDQGNVSSMVDPHIINGNLAVEISIESARLLEKLAQMGIYGRTPAEVAARFIDKSLEEFVDRPRFQLY